jgi:serine/threonine protein kinase
MLTGAGVTLGTIAYMSPEQLRGLALDTRSDLFSFGLVLHEMVAGTLAFSGATAAEIAGAILHQAPPALRSVRGDVPPRFEDIVLKALEKDRDDRYQTAADLRADLRRLKRDMESQPVVMPESPTAKDDREARRKARRELRREGTRQIAAIANRASGRPRRVRRTLRVALVIAGVLAARQCLLKQQQGTPSSERAQPPREELQIEQLTTSGRARGSAISTLDRQLWRMAISRSVTSNDMVVFKGIR